MLRAFRLVSILLFSSDTYVRRRPIKGKRASTRSGVDSSVPHSTLKTNSLASVKEQDGKLRKVAKVRSSDIFALSHALSG